METNGNAFEERESLGLVRVGEEGREGELWLNMMCSGDEDEDILERWEEVFEGLDI